jgi:hypothetical protein
MRWRDKVDIMGALLLQMKHLGCQLIGIQNSGRVALKLLTYLVILAEYTGKIATGKENGAGAFGAGDGGLLAEMEVDVANLDRCRNPAITELAGKPVHAATARAA